MGANHCEKYGAEILEDIIVIIQNVVEMLDARHKVLKFI